MAKRASLCDHTGGDTVLVRFRTVLLSIVVRESCDPFYEPSYTEHSHGCSQEIQVKRWQEEVAVRILRTQEWRRSEAFEQKARWCTQVQRKKVIAS